MEIKDILRDRRLEMGLTMREVADLCGVSEATVSRWESGDIANMKRDKIAALAAALKLSPAVIMGWEDPQVYYTNEETAREAQEMFEDPDLRALFHMKKDIDPAVFAAHMRMMHELYDAEHRRRND